MPGVGFANPLGLFHISIQQKSHRKHLKHLGCDWTVPPSIAFKADRSDFLYSQLRVSNSSRLPHGTWGNKSRVPLPFGELRGSTASQEQSKTCFPPTKAFNSVLCSYLSTKRPSSSDELDFLCSIHADFISSSQAHSHFFFFFFCGFCKGCLQRGLTIERTPGDSMRRLSENASDWSF